jgi:hypothetical protein
VQRQAEVLDFLTTPEWPDPNRFWDLLKVGVAAGGFMPPFYRRSIFGKYRSFAPPHTEYSEYNIGNPWRLKRALRFVADVLGPAYPTTAPDWARSLLPPIVTRRFWRPTHFFRHPDEYGGASSFPDEHWFFVNGICTNEDVARMNAEYLAHLFHRPVTVVQNATDSVWVDLYECALGKGFKDDPNSKDRKTMTEPAWRATAAILEALNAPQTKRVVVLAHSQGTIIVANVLRAVAKALRSDLARRPNAEWHPFADSLMGGVHTETQKSVRDGLAHSFAVLSTGGLDQALRRLEKLEIYTFANCADRMRYVDPFERVPYMEHFANERDLVARLGVLSPFRGNAKKQTDIDASMQVQTRKWGRLVKFSLHRGDANPLIEIDGPAFVQKGAWGHLLNEHYLSSIDEFLYPRCGRHHSDEDPFPPEGQHRMKPRLYEYFHGKRPEGPRR